MLKLHTILGILFDSNLTFTPFQCAVVRRIRASFLEIFHAGEVAGFSVPVIAAQVPLRLEPVLFYGAAFLVLAPEAATAVNRRVRRAA